MKNNKFSTEVIEIPFNDVEFDDVFITSKGDYLRSSFFDTLKYNGLYSPENFFAFEIFYNMRDYLIPENSKRRRICKVIISFKPSTKIKIKRRGLEVGYHELLSYSYATNSPSSIVFGNFDVNMSGNFIVVLIFCKRKKNETEKELKNVYVSFWPYSELEAIHFQDKEALLKAIELELI